MPEQLDLLSYSPPAAYPQRPGYKARSTSFDAAEAIAPRAATLRAKALRIIQRRPSSADEVASDLGESVLSIRPRVAELAKQGLIIQTADRRKNQSGRPAIVWKATG